MLPLAPPVPKVLQLSPGPSAVLLGAGFLPASSLAGQTAANLPATLLSVTKLKVPRRDVRPHKFNKVGTPRSLHLLPRVTESQHSPAGTGGKGKSGEVSRTKCTCHL